MKFIIYALSTTFLSFLLSVYVKGQIDTEANLWVLMGFFMLAPGTLFTITTNMGKLKVTEEIPDWHAYPLISMLIGAIMTCFGLTKMFFL